MVIPLFISAQTIEVVYSNQSKWEINDSINTNENYKKELLKAMNSKNYYKLLVNDSISIYKSIPKIDNSSSSNIKVKFSSSESFLFKNTKNKTFITEETYPKKYFIYDSLPIINWQITRQSKDILGYKTYKATAVLNDYKLNAYYSTKISIPNGPNEYWGLPGLILSIEIIYKNNEEITTINAEEISITNESIKTPKIEKRNTITKEEFTKIFNEFVKKENEYFNEGVDTSD